MCTLLKDIFFSVYPVLASIWPLFCSVDLGDGRRQNPKNPKEALPHSNKSGAPRPRSTSRSPRVMVDQAGDQASGLAQAKGGTSPLPPGVPINAPSLVRRVSLGSTGLSGGGGKTLSPASMRRAISLQVGCAAGAFTSLCPLVISF